MSCDTSSVIICLTTRCVEGPATGDAKRTADPAHTDRLPECVGDVVKARELRSNERHDAGTGGSFTQNRRSVSSSQKTVRPSNLADGDLEPPAASVPACQQ